MLPGYIYDYCKKHNLFSNLALEESPISPDDTIHSPKANEGSIELAQ
jgi:hypothetical protein